MNNTASKLRLLALVTILLVPAVVLAQDPRASLANLPDADVLIYVSPQKLLNEATPRLLPPADIAKMRTAFGDLKKGFGVDPATIEYLVIALRFHKPAGDLSFIAPDVMAVAGGDFSADSLVSLAELSLQEKVRTEKHGSKTIALMTVDEIAAQSVKNPMLKSLSEVGAVALSPNSIAIGNLPYLKSAIEAGEGTGRINPATLESLLRDPNALVAASGAPLASFAKAFGLFGTETTPRESRCDTPFGNFYAAITMSGTNFNIRGAMNADNSDTAKIISGLLAGLMQQGINAVPDKEAQSILTSIKMTPRENEIVWEADIPEQVVANLFKPKPPVQDVKQTSPAKKRSVRRKRNR
ncbi:MAG TPA: hypothetical protein VK893_01100 [Pyrinomonadaceae bacterium]|nr:hypothetical protein [Pyrinomonadaceae bacterium]